MRIKASDIPNVKNMTFGEIAEYCKKNRITEIELDKIDDEYAYDIFRNAIDSQTGKIAYRIYDLRDVKKIYHFPVELLLHYLVGTGRNKKVPAKVVKQAEAISINHMENETLGGLYAVNHSILYEGAGFHDRPSLFIF